MKMVANFGLTGVDGRLTKGQIGFSWSLFGKNGIVLLPKVDGIYIRNRRKYKLITQVGVSRQLRFERTKSS